MHALCQSMLELARWRGALGGGPRCFGLGSWNRLHLQPVRRLRPSRARAIFCCGREGWEPLIRYVSASVAGRSAD